jgi:nicotinamidase-related amidase
MTGILHAQWSNLNLVEMIRRGAAFLNMDAQNSILDPEGCLSHEGIWRGARDVGGSLHNALRVASCARAASIPLVWLRYDRFVGETQPSSELDRAQYRFWNANYTGDRARKTWESALVAEVEAQLQPNDLTLVYPGWSIFTGTGLERWLNQWGAHTLFLSGYHTDWCVEMAARHARELGYSPIVIGDATGTTQPLHDQTLARIDASFAPVFSTEAVVAAINAAGNIGARDIRL